MQNVLPYVRNTGSFLEKIEGVGEIPDNALFVSTDVVNLCPSISYRARLSAFEEAFNKRNLRKILIETLAKIAEFPTDTPPNACIYMDQVENGFLAT